MATDASAGSAEAISAGLFDDSEPTRNITVKLTGSQYAGKTVRWALVCSVSGRRAKLRALSVLRRSEAAAGTQVRINSVSDVIELVSAAGAPGPPEVSVTVLVQPTSSLRKLHARLVA